MEEQPFDNTVHLGRFLCLVLRHKPEAAGINLDRNGWANVDELVAGINQTGRHIDVELLKQIVKDDKKQRYTFNDDCTKIRANQGHSIVGIDVNLSEQTPPTVLYHGTAERFLPSIKQCGLGKQKRLYVHLSTDIATAVSVGSRHGKPVVLQIDTQQMIKDGFKFFLSQNGVWLCDSVPFKYCKLVDSRPVTVNNLK